MPDAWAAGRIELSVRGLAGVVSDGRGRPLDGPAMGKAGAIRGEGGSQGVEIPTGTLIVHIVDVAGGFGGWLWPK